MEQEKLYIHDKVIERLDLSVDLADQEISEMIEQEILARSRGVYLSIAEKRILKKELFNALRKLDVLSELLEDGDISEIMINGQNHIFIEKHGRLEHVKVSFSSEERLRYVIQQIFYSSWCGQSITFLSVEEPEAERLPFKCFK